MKRRLFLALALSASLFALTLPTRSQGLLVVQRKKVSAPAPSGPTLVQQKTATAGDGSAGVTATFDAPLTAGNSVVALISFTDVATFDGNPALVGGGAESLTGAVNTFVAGVFGTLYYVHAVAGGETALSFALDSPVRASVNVQEWSGLANSVPTATSTNSGVAATAVSTGSVAPVMPNNLIIGMYASVLNSYVSGPTGGFTALTSTGGTGAFQRAGYLIQSAATSANPGWTTTADNFAASAVAFAGVVQSSAVVSGAGTAAANGTYTFRGMSGDSPYYNLVGQLANPFAASVVAGNGSPWSIIPIDGSDPYYVAGDVVPPAFPWLATGWDGGGIGANPPPVVTEIP